jgi:hypothetical protein
VAREVAKEVGLLMVVELPLQGSLLLLLRPKCTHMVRFRISLRYIPEHSKQDITTVMRSCLDQSSLGKGDSSFSYISKLRALKNKILYLERRKYYKTLLQFK